MIDVVVVIGSAPAAPLAHELTRRGLKVVLFGQNPPVATFSQNPGEAFGS
jgi:hypothetical protein